MKLKIKQKSALIGLILIGLFLIFMLPKLSADKTPEPQLKNLKIGSKTIQVEVADSKNEIIQGLSGRKSLPQGQGMYFELERRQIAHFWMKDMNFPLDIIWIDEEKVAGFVENAPVPIGSDIPTFNSKVEVTKVLEVNAGFVKENNIKVGDRIAFQ